MKKELKVTAVVLAAIIVFLAGFGLGNSKGIQINVDVKGNQSSAAAANNSASPAATPATTAPTTATPAPSQDSAPADNNADASKPADSNAGSPSAIPQTPKEVTAKYNEVVNNLKKAQNATIHKVGAVNIECTDCSVGFLKSIVNTIVKSFITSSDENIQFANGQGQNSKGETKTVNDFIYPCGRDSAITENDVASATAAAEGDGYKMTIVIKSEKSTYDGTNTTDPTSHMTAMDPLNLATLELPMGAQITNADMTYPGATCEATVDGSGNLVKLHINLPLEGSGTGSLKGATLTVGLKGSMDDTFDITY